MSSKKNWARLVAVLGVLVTVVSVLNGSGVVYARGTEVYAAMMDKAVYQGVYKCYKQTDDTIVRKLKLSKYDGLKSLVGKDASKHNIALITGVTSNSFFEGSRYKVWDGKVSCKNLFLGNNTGIGGTNYDILTASGKKAPDPNDGSGVKKFMQNMGYTISGGSSETKCYNAKFTRKTGTDKGTYSTNGVCKNGDKLSAETISASSKNIPFFKVSGSKVCLYEKYTQADINGTKTLERKVGCSAPGDKLSAAGLADLATKQCTAKSWCASKYTFSAGSKTDSTAKATADRGSDDKKAALAAIRFLSGDSKYTTLDSIKTTEIEKRLLYQQYLTSYYGVKVGCSGESGGNWSSTKINWLDAGSKTMKQCVYDKSSLKKSSGSTVNGISVNNYYEMNKLYLKKTKKEEPANLDNLLAAIGELPAEYTEEQLKEIDAIAGSGVEGMSEEEQESTCAGAGGSRSLGWVVCPLLEWLGDAAERTYNEYVEPSLQVSPKLFSEGGDATSVAWGNFRDMANVVFVIAILAVILSQLTGVGIDNYGIKRILPKLIVVAVLINLSYLLCLLAIDVSNILGNSFQALFKGMEEGMTLTNYTITADTGTSGSINTAEISGLTGVAILGGIVGAGAAIWANPAILLSLLVAAVGVVVSVFFLFILLAAREAAIVVLVIVSPVAMIMYALPNTKKIFDKWLSAFKGLLLVYPICGLLVGAGGYVSKLLIYAGGADQGFISSFTAMIVSIVPIFFIPTLLKNSFAAMGNIGARISGIGQRMSRGTMGRIQRSDRFQRLQGMGRERAGNLRQEADVRRAERMLAGIRPGQYLSASQRRRVRKAQGLVQEYDSNQRRDNRMLNGGFEAAMAGMESKARDEEINDQLALMRSAGGGIMLGNEDEHGNIITTDENGNDIRTQRPFTLNNANDRLDQLERVARGRELTDAEQLEAAALMRGLSGMKGGASKINNIVRGAHAEQDDNAVNRNFMRVVGDVYSQDSGVASAMNTKDGKIGSYVENFMPGGSGLQSDEQGNPRGQSYAAAAANGGLQDRAKSYEAKLNQGGKALEETIAGLSAADCQAIYDQEAERNLDAEDFDTFRQHAKSLGVTGKSIQKVSVEQNNSQANSNGGTGSGPTQDSGTQTGANGTGMSGASTNQTGAGGAGTNQTGAGGAGTNQTGVGGASAGRTSTGNAGMGRTNAGGAGANRTGARGNSPRGPVPEGYTETDSGIVIPHNHR